MIAKNQVNTHAVDLRERTLWFMAFWKFGKETNMSSRQKHRLTVNNENEFAVVTLEDMEIWDGADLAQLREALTALIERNGQRAIGVQLSGVKHLPSGFFGMLFEWYEQGLKISLYNPQDNVKKMLWFRMFFVRQADDSYLLTDERMRNNTPDEQTELHRREFAHLGGSDELTDEEKRRMKYSL